MLLLVLRRRGIFAPRNGLGLWLRFVLNSDPLDLYGGAMLLGPPSTPANLGV